MIRKLFLPTMLLILGCWAAFANDPILKFGRTGGPRPLYAHAFQRTSNLALANLKPGPWVLDDSSILKQTGGGLLTSRAEFVPALARQKWQLHYSKDKPNGARLEITSGDQHLTVDAYDWEIYPLTRFVDSNHNGSINILVKEDGFNIDLDGAFINTLLGLRIIQADLITSGFLSQDFLPRLDNRLILGDGEAPFLADDKRAGDAAAEFDKIVGTNESVYSVITDAGARFIVAERLGQNIAIVGRPFLFAWDMGPPPKNEVRPANIYNSNFDRNWDLMRQANPILIREIERMYRLTAFLRAEKDNPTSNWLDFAHETQVIELQLPVVSTPSLLATSPPPSR